MILRYVLLCSAKCSWAAGVHDQEPGECCDEMRKKDANLVTVLPLPEGSSRAVISPGAGAGQE